MYTAFLNIIKFHSLRDSLQQAALVRFSKSCTVLSVGIAKFRIDQTFSQNVLFTDKATFTNHRQVNARNVHYWAAENSHLRQWCVNVWCGVTRNSIIGPYFTEGNVSGERHAAFLLNTLPLLLEDMP